MGVVNLAEGLAEFRGTKITAFKGRVVSAGAEFFVRDGNDERTYRFPNADFRVRPGSVVSIITVHPPGMNPITLIAKNHDTNQVVRLAQCPIQGYGPGPGKGFTILGLVLQIAWFFKTTNHTTAWNPNGMGQQPFTRSHDEAIVIGVFGLICLGFGLVAWIRRGSKNHLLTMQLEDQLMAILKQLDQAPLSQAAAE